MELDKTALVGCMSIVFLILTIVILPSPIILILMVIGFLYTPYKTLYKKEKLDTSEWLAFAGLTILLFAVIGLNLFVV